jgi:hypothetical protein
MVAITPKAGRETNFEELQSAGVFNLNHLNSNGAEPAALTQVELYQTAEGASEVWDAADHLITLMGQYDRCRFIYRGSPRRWEQIA